MTKLTKAQLVAEIEALRNELNTLRHLSAADMLTIQCLIEAAQPSPNLLHTNDLIDADDIRALHAKPVKPVYIPPAWQLERKAAMETAKAQAMQSGSRVMVQS